MKMLVLEVTPSSVAVLVAVAASSALFLRVFYNLYLHPLAKFPGPWYTSATSFSGAIISVLKFEPQWLLGLTKKYGSMPFSKILCFFATLRLTVVLFSCSQYSDSHLPHDVDVPKTFGLERNLLGSEVQPEVRTLWFWYSWAPSFVYHPRWRCTQISQESAGRATGT